MAFVILVSISIACEKEPDPEPDPIYYTVKTSVVGLGGTTSPQGESKVLKGSNLLITVTVNPGFRIDSILINGIKKPLTDNKYYLNNINVDYVVEVSFKVDYAYILGQHEWKLEGYYNLDLDGDKVWYYTQYWGVPGYPRYVWNFSPNGKIYIYLDNGPDPVGEGDWRLNQDVTPMILNLSGKLYTVEALNLKGDSLVILDDYVPVIGGRPGQITSIKSYFSKL